jgi:hypothetical protein
MISIMFILCKLILATLAVSLVMAVDDGEFVLKPCAGGVFEETYFNFDIYIDNFSEDCEDFEKMSEKIQLMIEKVEKMIPEYQDEFIDAEVCSLPTFVGRRRLAKRKSGTYSFAGAGGCKRCTGSKTDRRNLQAESFEKRVCETLLASAAVDAAVAERAVVKAKEKLEEILARAVDKETREYLDERETDQFVKNAEKELEECKEKAGMAKARVLFFETACKSADFASVVAPEDQQGFEMVANEMDKDIHQGAKDAQKGFYNVKDEDINLKTEIVKSKFHKKEEEFRAEVSNLKTELEAECNTLKQEMTRIQQQIKIAKKARNKTLETELLGQIEALNHQAIALQDEFNSFTELKKETIDHDFELALGIIHAEAANTFEDYMQAFAELMTKGLAGYLKLEDEFSSCFEKEPKVKVTVNSLKDEKEKVVLRRLTNRCRIQGEV